jgi:hypothetical protein
MGFGVLHIGGGSAACTKALHNKNEMIPIVRFIRSPMFLKFECSTYCFLPERFDNACEVRHGSRDKSRRNLCRASLRFGRQTPRESVDEQSLQLDY